MKKYILRLCLCVVLLVGVVLLALLIRSKVDGFVKSRLPEQETKISATTAPTKATTNPTTKPTTGEMLDLNPSGGTDPSNSTDPSDSTGPGESSEHSTNPTTATTAPTTATTAPTTATTAPTTATTAPTTATTTPTTAPTTPPPSGQTAPAVTFYDSQGNGVNLTAFKDKPVVLCFWASWATGTGETLDLLQTAYNKYGDKVYFVVVNLTTTPRETKEAAEAYWATTNYTFSTYYDLDGTCRSAFKADTVPTTFFMKEENLALAFFKGKLTRFGLSVGLDCILPQE